MANEEWINMFINKFNENSEIQEMLKKADLLLRPYALYINPKNKELFNKVEDKVKIYSTELVEPGKMYLVDRKKLEFPFL